MKEVLEAALKAGETGEPAALVTVVSTEGSTPQKAGAKMVVYADGRIVGTIGGGCVEAEMTWRARQTIEKRRPQMASYELTADQAGEDGLICGGRMEVFIEPIESSPVLCLFGAGHVAQPLCRMAKSVGFRVELVDDRAKFANRDRFPEADLILVEEFPEAARRMTLGLRFVGLLASRPKFVHVAAALEDRGIPPEEVAKVHAPLGLELGAVSPEEIAVSVLAEMIAVRRGVDPAAVRPMRMELPGRLKAGR
jgi:xanthine dehydrogenase accessory factor